MFLRKENRNKPPTELLNQLNSTQEPQTSSLFKTLSLALQAEQAVEKIVARNPLLKFFKPLKEQPSDPIENYLQRFFEHPNQELALQVAKTDQERAAILTPDFIHTIWEMIEAKKETVFNIELDGKDGYGDGYSEAMKLQLANFVRVIEKQGLLASRSFLEQVVFQKTYNQLFAIAESHLEKLQNVAENKATPLLPPIAIMVTSPPDNFAAGYHGADSLSNWNTPEHHHSFHFVYLIDQIKTTRDEHGKLVITNASVKVTQLRTWHNIQGLLNLHERLGAPLTVDKKLPVTNQVLANAISFKFSENDSQQDILDYFRKELYIDENKWAKNSDQAPEFSIEGKEKLWQELGMLSLEDQEKSPQKSLFHEVYLKPVLELLRNISDEEVQNSRVKEQLSKQLKLRTQVFLQAVELRVRELNINPEYTELVKKNMLFSALKNPLQLPAILKQLRELSSEEIGVPLTNSDRLQKIVQSHHLLEQTQVFGKKLSKEDQNWLAANYSSVFAVGNFAFGSMQCYTIGTLQIPTKMIDLSSGANFSPMMLEALSQVDTNTKKQLLEDLEQQNYVELDLPGANRVWMVPASYMTEPGCRVDDQGMVCGPCITNDFPLGIPFDHPLEQANPLGPLPMDKTQFAHYLKTLRENILQDQLEDQLNFDQLSEKEKTTSQLLIKRLVRTLFKVNLSTLIAGIDEQSETAHKLPQEKLRKITSVESLQKLVIELEQDDDETAQSELSELEEFALAA